MFRKSTLSNTRRRLPPLDLITISMCCFPLPMRSLMYVPYLVTCVVLFTKIESESKHILANGQQHVESKTHRSKKRNKHTRGQHNTISIVFFILLLTLLGDGSESNWTSSWTYCCTCSSLCKTHKAHTAHSSSSPRNSIACPH